VRLYKITSVQIDGERHVNHVAASTIDQALKHGRYFRGGADVSSIELICDELIDAELPEGHPIGGI